MWRWLAADPRHIQISILAALNLYGAVALDFEVDPTVAVATIGTALLTQAVLSRWTGQPYDPRSALISGLGLVMLLRAPGVAWMVAAAIATIASKHVVRFRGKHVFNPTNFAIVGGMLLTDRLWVSPGQWGSVALFALLVACVGSLVTQRSERWDIPVAFLSFYAAILVGRSLWLSEPMTIPLHRLQNGALLIFTFFMISDPKTTPDSRAGRVLYAALVAIGAGYVHFVQYAYNGPMWALFFLSPLVPVIDKVLRGERYVWPTHRVRQPSVGFLKATALATKV